jgi:hypothetical protein
MKQAQGAAPKPKNTDAETPKNKKDSTSDRNDGSIDVAAFQTAWSHLKFGQPPAEAE